MAEPTPQARKTGKAFGERLSDFPRLTKAEQKLIKHCRIGKLCELGDRVPANRTAANAIRPELIRFLALGGDDDAPVHPKGVQLQGAWIGGDLDLESCHCPRPLWLHECRIRGDLIALYAELPLLSLAGSQIGDILGDGLRVRDGVFLRNSFKAEGPVRMLRAKIGGYLDCVNGSFTAKDGIALDCEGAVITGDVYLRDGFKAAGPVRMLGAQIGGDLSCDNGSFTANDGNALDCDGAVITGSMFLRNGFKAEGPVRLLGARIGSNLECDNGSFIAKDGIALDCDGAVITGGVFFRNVTEVAGAVDLSACTAGELDDDAAGWGMVSRHGLNGFRYGRITGGPTDATTRIDWLKTKQLAGREHVFWPQPWEQLIKVLREMGHEEDAKLVAMAKQDEMRARGKIRPLARPFHALFGWFAGYGYRPLRTVGAMLGVWVVCSLFYYGASVTGTMAPSDAITVEQHAGGCGKPIGALHSTWTTCPELPKEYTTFSPWFYSLDVILPLVDLQQEKSWAPLVMEDDAKTWIWRGVIVRFVMWFEILFGWGASLLLAAVLGNLPKRD